MQEYDLIIRNGMIYDGSGQPPFKGDAAINGDAIAAVGDLGDARGKTEVDAAGKAVAPGFINMLSWSVESLIEDGRSQSEIRQGVTLEVMGEGASMGPLNDQMKAAGPNTFLQQGDIQYDVEWGTLGEYLEYLEKRGVSCNIASFVGTSTLRVHVIGYDDREATWDELLQMSRLVRQAMEEGAVGLSSALIYPPASYAGIDELIILALAAAEYDGLYISHIRSEGSAILDAVDEFLEIASAARIRSEIYHLKAAGRSNWEKMDEVIRIIEQERADGLQITADMYPYPFAGTGLDACLPPWVHDGGHEAKIARLKDPAVRERIKQEMNTPSEEWENMFLENGAEAILVSGFKQEHMKPLTGRYLADIAAERGTSPEDTLMDMIVEDDSRIFTMYFSMSEDNVRKIMALPWVSFCSDAESQAPEGPFLKSNPHPRAYGTFARILGKYVRDEGIIPLEEAIRRLTAFPAANLKIERRGSLQAGYYADVVVFDPASVQDHATPEKPHQYATGMTHVWVNGVQVLQDGEHTGAKPGRVVRGPGYGKKPLRFDYQEALHPLLSLGGDYDGTYAEFDLGYALIPDLIRMATDSRLLEQEEDVPEYFAPAHAWRRLGQFGAVAAAEPLTKLLSVFREDAARELPEVYGMIGPAAIPVLKTYLEEDMFFDLGKMSAANCLVQIAEASDDLVADACEIVLMDTLRQHRYNNPLLNTLLIRHLIDMGSEDAVPVIVEAYRAGDVNEEAGLTFKEACEQMGIPFEWEKEQKRLKRSREEELSFFPESQSQRKSDPKKKAKRKQAAKMKKQNRKKKR